MSDLATILNPQPASKRFVASYLAEVPPSFVINAGQELIIADTGDTYIGDGHSTLAALPSSNTSAAKNKLTKINAVLAATKYTNNGFGAEWPLMASPPAVVYSGGGAASAIVAKVFVPLIGGAFSLSGPSTTAYSAQAGFVGPSSLSGTGNETCTLWIEFDTDAPVFEVMYLGTASPSYKLIIDGEAVTATAQTATGSSGVYHLMKVTNADRRLRHILIESGSMGVSNILIGPTDTLTNPGISRPKLVIVGDSYLVNQSNTVGTTVARMLGMSVFSDGSGGTGYNNNQGGASGKATFVVRVPTVVALVNPDALAIYGAVNDSTTTLTADCLAAINAARTVSRDLPIVIIGSQNPPSAVGSAATKSALLKAAALAGNAAYIDPVTGNIYDNTGVSIYTGSPWITGTGTTSASSGVGNADFYIGADTTHPSTTSGILNGYLYHGVRLAQALRIALPKSV